MRSVVCSGSPVSLSITLMHGLFGSRSWKTDLPKGMCTLVSLSVEHEEARPMGGVRAVVMDSQYLIEPCGSGKSRLTHICRIDLK